MGCIYCGLSNFLKVLLILLSIYLSLPLLCTCYGQIKIVLHMLILSMILSPSALLFSLFAASISFPSFFALLFAIFGSLLFLPC